MRPSFTNWDWDHKLTRKHFDWANKSSEQSTHLFIYFISLHTDFLLPPADLKLSLVSLFIPSSSICILYLSPNIMRSWTKRWCRFSPVRNWKPEQRTVKYDKTLDLCLSVKSIMVTAGLCSVGRAAFTVQGVARGHVETCELTLLQIWRSRGMWAVCMCLGVEVEVEVAAAAAAVYRGSSL